MMGSRSNKRVAVVLSHPIQHFCPQFGSWSKLPGIDLHVFFASRHGLNPYEDKGFGRTVQWAGLKLDFPHTFLPDAEGRVVDKHTDHPDLERELVEFRPDAVVVYGYAMKLQRRAARWAAAHGANTIMVSDSDLHRRVAWVKRAVKALMLPHRYARISAFLTVGDSNEAYYRQHGVGDRKLVRSAFPIDVQRYDEVLREREHTRRQLRTELGIPAHHTVLLMVGKLVPWKRQIDLVEFSNACQGHRDDITVILAGTGRDEADLRAAALRSGPGGVILAGFVPPTALPAYYCATDVYVHCSEAEPHSLAISEAIYTGLPVVLSDRCGSYGPTDDVRTGQNGFVYACGDAAALATALEALADDPGLRDALGRASSEIARERQNLAHGTALTHLMQALEMERRQATTVKARQHESASS